MKQLVQIAIILSLFPLSSLASNLSFGLPVVGGSGCANANVRWEVSPVGNILLIVDANSKAIDNLRLSRVSCMIAVPVSVGVGEMLIVKSVALVSSLKIPKKSKASMSLEVFEGGSRGKLITQRVRNGSQITPPVLVGSDLLFIQNAETNLRINASTMLRNQSSKEAGENGIEALIVELEQK